MPDSRQIRAEKLFDGLFEFGNPDENETSKQEAITMIVRCLTADAHAAAQQQREADAKVADLPMCVSDETGCQCGHAIAMAIRTAKLVTEPEAVPR